MTKPTLHKQRIGTTKAFTTFVSLPVPLQRPITGGCQCAFCKAHPNRPPMWDTLATDGVDSWTVHYPEPWHREEIVK
jgi:hypothetical protein